MYRTTSYASVTGCTSVSVTHQQRRLKRFGRTATADAEMGYQHALHAVILVDDQDIDPRYT